MKVVFLQSAGEETISFDISSVPENYISPATRSTALRKINTTLGQNCRSKSDLEKYFFSNASGQGFSEGLWNLS